MQAREIEKAYEELKVTQAQLIQSEKMASLGELTAGIAHEIQNPLNFVNNFSEVNSELVEELMEEIKKGDMEEAQLIVKDILENEQKIKLHGQHASVIVKGMLEHSRASDGKKELTNINALADEYLRLAYHGFRAKDKSFNADFKTEFDESIPKISIIPQDIGRVLLNLINNAFYAVSEAQKNWVKETASAVKALPDRQSGSATEDSGYQPEVIVSSKKHSNYIEICVKDNGSGIPAEIKDKIFQPFFTTKPTGSGTGLGLSLSYDIVKAHRGDLELETSEQEGSKFYIKLPID
jgi:signal transduction histidine kinase